MGSKNKSFDYVHEDYPKFITTKDNRRIIVKSKEEEEKELGVKASVKKK